MRAYAFAMPYGMELRVAFASMLISASAAATPDALAGQFAYVADADGDRVVVVDLASPSVTGSIAVGRRPIDLLLDPSTARLYVANNYDGSISVVDTADHSIVATVPGLTDVRGLAMNASGTRLFVAAYDFVQEIDTTTNRPVGARLPVAAGPCLLVSGKPAVDPSGYTVYVPVADCMFPFELPGMLAIIDVRDPAAVAEVEVGAYPTGATLDVAHHHVYVTNWFDGSISIVDTREQVVVDTLPIGEYAYPTVTAADPAGEHLYVTDNGSGGVRVIDTAAGAISGDAIDVGAAAFGIALSGDGARAYVGKQTGDFMTIDTATRRVLGEPLAIGGNLVALALAGDKLFCDGFD